MIDCRQDHLHADPHQHKGEARTQVMESILRVSKQEVQVAKTEDGERV